MVADNYCHIGTLAGQQQFGKLLRLNRFCCLSHVEEEEEELQKQHSCLQNDAGLLVGEKRKKIQSLGSKKVRGSGQKGG